MGTQQQRQIPRGEQTVADLAKRITPAKRELMEAIKAGRVVWCGSVTTCREGRRTRQVTGEVNWLRSHRLAHLPTETMGKPQRPVALTSRGHEILASRAGAGA